MTVVEPAFFPVTTPFLVTEAILFFLEVQVVVLTFFKFFFTTLNFTFFPTVTDTDVFFKLTLAFFAAKAGIEFVPVITSANAIVEARHFLKNFFLI